jgi:acetyl-CoA acetyltransferase
LRADVTRFAATSRAASDARTMAGVGCDDIDIVEIHDAFASFELINLEEMGFYDIGTSWRALVAGELTIGGKLCVNASGGMKAKGHPIGATGLSASAEMLAQLTGEAGSRQHSGARLGMIQSVGGVSKDSYVFIVAGSGA